VADELLLDTGAFVALIDRSEKRHADCVALLDSWRGVIVTTEAVVTETLDLVGPQWKAQRSVLQFLLRGAFLLVPVSPATLKRIEVLMERYRNVPMDFADATLVALGEELGTEKVFTLDHRGFGAYRLHRKTAFQLFP
jgi:predicted nucleic acid-binding protein